MNTQLMRTISSLSLLQSGIARVSVNSNSSHLTHAAFGYAPAQIWLPIMGTKTTPKLEPRTLNPITP
jgi:hypothetical protein